MSSLHTINKPNQPFQSCYKALGENDEILLIEDGIYCLLENADRLNTLNHQIYALSDDLIARGVKLNESRAKALSFDEFVALTTRHQKIISWF